MSEPIFAPTNIFDTHAHYDDEAFAPDRDELLAALPERGVCGVITAAVDAASAHAAIALAEQYPYVWAAVGIHPETAAAATEADLAAIRALTDHPRVVAVGGVGLDYHWEGACPREVQEVWFRRQLELAVERDLPVVVHDRDAHADTLALLGAVRPRGVIHCFSGSVQTMREAVALGLYIGLGGVVTFKNARRAVEVATAVPLDRLLLETDAPYMAPEPFRGHRCDSAHIVRAAERIAALRGMTAQEVLDITAANARRLFLREP